MAARGGSGGAAQGAAAVHDAFPDLRMEAHDILEDGNKVIVRGTMSGSHKSDFMGMPAAGQSFSVQFIDIVEFRDGRAIAHWGLTDQAAMMQQPGMMPEM